MSGIKPTYYYAGPHKEAKFHLEKLAWQVKIQNNPLKLIGNHYADNRFTSDCPCHLTRYQGMRIDVNHSDCEGGGQLSQDSDSRDSERMSQEESDLWANLVLLGSHGRSPSKGSCSAENNKLTHGAVWRTLLSRISSRSPL